MPREREPFALACRRRRLANLLPGPPLGCDRSGTLEYALSGRHVYAFGPDGAPPRRVAPLRSPNRATPSLAKGDPV